MIRAVICDDEKAALNIIRYFIESANLPIEIVGMAENGRDALKLIQELQPELAFMDIRMPYLDGFEVIQSVKDTKVIIITAYDSFAAAQKALRLGASDIISKPIDMVQLKEAIERAIGWKFTESEAVNCALEYIYTHYEQNITIEELAQASYCSQSHISRLFKKCMDISVLSYIHKVRIDRAIEYIKEEKLGIQEIAEKVGYQNLNNFYKYFKQQTGETPAAFMQEQKNRR